jgi:hypothetical protein
LLLNNTSKQPEYQDNKNRTKPLESSLYTSYCYTVVQSKTRVTKR